MDRQSFFTLITEEADALPTQVYERMSYPAAVYVDTPYRTYPRTTYVGANSYYYPGGGMGGGGMH